MERSKWMVANTWRHLRPADGCRVNADWDEETLLPLILETLDASAVGPCCGSKAGMFADGGREGTVGRHRGCKAR